jgi:hypothetical protein
MSMRKSLAIAGLLLLFASSAWAQAPCSVLNTAPPLQPGGNVFGSSQAQWLAYFQGKVDGNNGTACNLNVTGSLTFDGTPGASCSGTPTSAFAVVNGIVTHC